jgi:hypothetical protein
MKLAFLVGACALALAASPPTVLAIGPGDATAAEPGSAPRAGAGVGLLIPGGEAAAALVEEPDGASVITIHAHQSTTDNVVELQDFSGSTLIEGSFNANAGIVSVNQDSGNANSQANVRAFVMGASLEAAGVLAIRVEQVERDNVVNTPGAVHDDRIVDSFNGNLGIIGVNQSSGSLNQQLNLLVMGTGALIELPPIQDAELDEVRGAGQVAEVAGDIGGSIVDSFGDFGGVAQVTQASGNANTIRNVLAISFSPAGSGGQP